jgi:hypothetical protein
MEDGFDVSQAFEKEGEIHRHFNINDGFDALEINGPSFIRIQDQLNRLLVKKIQKGTFENVEIDAVKNKLRLYDPSDQLVPRISKPPYVSWKGEGITEESFIEYSDADDLVKAFTERDKEWITVFENGQQRIHERSGDYAIYFEVTAFMAEKYADHSLFEDLKGEVLPYFLTDNVYRPELLRFYGTGFLDVHESIYPLIGSSTRNYRSRMEDCIAVILPELLSEQQINPDPISLCSPGQIEMIQWQDPVKSGDRRRFEPASIGTTLNVHKNIIRQILKKNGLSLYLYCSFRRSADKYKAESKMDWYEKVVVRPYML